MKKNFCKVACVQITATNDMADNCAAINHWVEKACLQGAELIALPENAFMMRASDKDQPALLNEQEHQGILLCQELARKFNCYILIGSVFAPSGIICPDSGCAKYYNRSLFIDDQGEIIARYDKIHLFDAHLAPGELYRESARVVAGRQVTCVDTPWGILGLAICYDVRFAHLFRDLAKAGAVMLAVPAAFAQHTGQAHWHVLLRARAIETGSFVIAPGQCGEHPGGRKTFGHSMIIDPWGVVLAEAGNEPGIIMADLDLERVTQIRAMLPCLQHDRDYLRPPEYII